MKTLIENFGRFNDHVVEKIVLKNNNNFQISLLSQGAIWNEFSVPVEENKKINLLLNFNSIDSYYSNPFYIGMSIGRTGGRIKAGKLTLNDTTYNLSQNENTNTLHGGETGFHSYIWDYETFQTDDTVSVVFSKRVSPQDDSYPGILDVEIEYILNNKNEVIINYYGKAVDQDTVFNPTNHAYFNLEQSNNILDHELKINSHQILSMDQEKNPTGLFKETAGTPYDFHKFTFLKNAIEDLQSIPEKGIDDVFYIDQPSDCPIATLKSNRFNHQIDIYSQRNGLVVFTANSFTSDMNLSTGKGHPYQGIALESQTLPDTLNHKNFGNILLKKGQSVTYQTKIAYTHN